MQFFIRKFVCLTLVGLVTSLGCGRSGPKREQVYPVTGQVLLEGKAIPNARITLVPTSKNPTGVVANATTNATGNFEVTTYVTADGAAIGEYAVTVQCTPLVKNGQSYERGPNILPAKLADPKTTDWKIQVAAQEANVLSPKHLQR